MENNKWYVRVKDLDIFVVNLNEDLAVNIAAARKGIH